MHHTFSMRSNPRPEPKSAVTPALSPLAKIDTHPEARSPPLAPAPNQHWLDHRVVRTGNQLKSGLAPVLLPRDASTEGGTETEKLERYQTRLFRGEISDAKNIKEKTDTLVKYTIMYFTPWERLRRAFIIKTGGNQSS